MTHAKKDTKTGREAAEAAEGAVPKTPEPFFATPDPTPVIAPDLEVRVRALETTVAKHTKLIAELSPPHASLSARLDAVEKLLRSHAEQISNVKVK